MKRQRVHPAAELLPLIQGEEFDALVASIKEHGLTHPVVVDADGVLLDGRNRLRACKVAKVEPRSAVYRGKDVIDYIVRVNVQRRHLTVGQRALLALEALPFYEAEAAKRQKAGVKADLGQTCHKVKLRGPVTRQPRQSGCRAVRCSRQSVCRQMPPTSPTTCAPAT